MKNQTELRELSSKIGQEMEYAKWCQEIPYIIFPSDWEVKIVPPFFCAVVRFSVKKGNALVSIYLDCYDTLGYYGEPYWEVYPVSGDVSRCAMQDIDSLVREITISIGEQNQS